MGTGNGGEVASRAEYLTTREAARILRLSPGTLANLRSAGGGPPYWKLRRMVRYRLDEVLEYAEARGMNATWEPRGRKGSGC